jgi:hypothetical protein
MKLPENQSDLQKFVESQIPEDLHLDYKASDAMSDKKKDEILKDVSAFANSEGGMLIYGIKEDKQNHTFSIDIGIETSTINWPEWVGQIIDSGISPQISEIKINSIKLDSGNFAYAIEIPKSSSAPHQSSDKKYYKRSNSQSQPMEHYEIDDIRNRSHIEELKDSLGKASDHLKKLSENIELIARNTGQIAKLESELFSYLIKSQPDPIIYEYDCRVVDVINSSYSLFEQNLSRFIYFINNDKNISEKLTILPQVKFTTWYESAKSTRSSMAGSGRLNFPQNELERISLLKTLFEEMATGKISYTEISHHFMYVSGKLDDCISEVVRLLFIPFARDVRSVLIIKNS